MDTAIHADIGICNTRASFASTYVTKYIVPRALDGITWTPHNAAKRTLAKSDGKQWRTPMARQVQLRNVYRPATTREYHHDQTVYGCAFTSFE